MCWSGWVGGKQGAEVEAAAFDGGVLAENLGVEAAVAGQAWGSPFPLGQAAQHDSRDTSRLNAWAASRSPSDMVRYGAQASARSVTVIPARIA